MTEFKLEPEEVNSGLWTWVNPECGELLLKLGVDVGVWTIAPLEHQVSYAPAMRVYYVTEEYKPLATCYYTLCALKETLYLDHEVGEGATPIFNAERIEQVRYAVNELARTFGAEDAQEALMGAVRLGGVDAALRILMSGSWKAEA